MGGTGGSKLSHSKEELNTFITEKNSLLFPCSLAVHPEGSPSQTCFSFAFLGIFKVSFFASKIYGKNKKYKALLGFLKY